jgi:two-component sensor histidine kinase
MHSYQVDSDKVELSLEIERIELDVDTLVPLGLIVNELITNALKYAFPDERSRTLAVSLKTSESALILEVNDNGVGFDPQQIRPDSFGQKLVRSLVRQLDGTLELNSENGTRARLEVRKFKALEAI